MDMLTVRVLKAQHPRAAMEYHSAPTTAIYSIHVIWCIDCVFQYVQDSHVHNPLAGWKLHKGGVKCNACSVMTEEHTWTT